MRGRCIKRDMRLIIFGHTDYLIAAKGGGGIGQNHRGRTSIGMAYKVADLVTQWVKWQTWM